MPRLRRRVAHKVGGIRFCIQLATIHCYVLLVGSAVSVAYIRLLVQLGKYNRLNTLPRLEEARDSHPLHAR